MTVSDVSVRAALAVGFSANAIYCVATETPMPEWLITLTASAVSFYFGGKAAEVPQVLARRQQEDMRDLLAEARAERGS